MAKGLLGVALLAGWLGVSASAYAQYAPAPGGAPGPAYPPAPGLDGPAPCPGEFGPPPLNNNTPPAESLPGNAFSAVHPETVRLAPHFEFGVDYLEWWVRKRQVPPLITLGNINDTIPGAGGQPNTVPVLGPGSLDRSEQSGVRLTAVWWFDQDHTFGVDGSAFWLPDVSLKVGTGGSGMVLNRLVLARPFFDVGSGTQSADPIVVPGVLGGAITVDSPRKFWGADMNLRCAACVDLGPVSRITLLAGARFLKVDEALHVDESLNELPSQGVAGSDILLTDNFVTSNRFYGAQVGLETETCVGQAVLTITGKFAAGTNLESVSVYGATLLTEPDGTQVFDPRRGLLVQPTNEVRVHRHQFAVAPSLNVKLAWVFNDYVRATLGYDFLYWNHVARPGDQIDRQVSVGPIGAPANFGNSPHPVMPFATTGFWAQGLTAGLQLSF